MMDAIARWRFLSDIEREFKELENSKPRKYCLWHCPKCERILISGGWFGYHGKMKKDVAVCVGSYAFHRPGKWFDYKGQEYNVNSYAEWVRNNEEFHTPTDMPVEEIELTREQYINTFE